MVTGLFRALAALMLVLFATPAFADGGSVGVPVRTCIQRASTGIDALAALHSPQGFDCTTPQTAFGPGDYLVVSERLTVGDERHPRIRVASLWQERSTLHILYADGRVWIERTDSRAASRRIQLGAIIEHEPPVRGAPIVRLLWHVEGAANLRGVVLDPRIATPAASARSNITLAAMYGAFGGLCFALLVYNAALWGALKHRFLLHYCVMVAALLFYALTSSGALAWAVPIDNNDRLRLNAVALAVSAVAALAFARSFFEPRVFQGRLGRATTVVSVGLLASAASSALFGAWWPLLFDRLNALSFLATIALVGPIFWRAWRERSQYVWLFAVGWSAPVAFAALRVGHAFGLVPWSFWLDNSTIVAMTAEALLSSLAIAYRISLLSRDRDRAREDESAARLLADIDPLTGLLNRRAFLDAAIGRDGEQLLLLADLDHFKRVNDTIGHDGGDEVLRLVARAFLDAVPPGALVARVGGEEFAIVASLDAPADAAEVLARLRAEPMPYDLEVTASIGVAQGRLLREADWKALYRLADQALFEAKASGRDRVRRALRAVA